MMLNMQALWASDLIPGVSWFLGFQSVIVRMTWWRKVGHDSQDAEQSLYLARLNKVPFGIASLEMSLSSFLKKNIDNTLFLDVIVIECKMFLHKHICQNSWSSTGGAV